MMPYFLFKGLEVNSGTCGCGAEVSTIFEMDVEMFEIVYVVNFMVQEGGKFRDV